MRPKSLLLLALAGGCGLVASIGISQVMDSNARQGGAALETAPIYVALHNINLGDPIEPSMVSLMEWPKDRIPPGAVVDMADLEGRRPRTNIIQGEPILDAKLLAQGEFADPIAQIPPGYRLVTISVDAEKSAAGLLSPGDRVDIQLFVNRNDRAGIDSARTKIILQNIRVYAVEQAVQRSAEGGEARAIPKTVSLVVTPQQASKVDLAQNLGQLSLIPRNPNDEADVAAAELTSDDLWNDGKSRNTREKEQGRAEVDKPRKKSGGLLSGFASMLRNAAENRPPFEMEVVLADDVTIVTFDPSTGKPIREPEAEGGSLGPQAPRAGGAASPEEAVLNSDDFPIDFGGEG